MERRRGRLPGTAYLRARADLWLHPEKPRELAERVAELSTSMPAFHELELLAAQAWAAAGEVRRARAFARDLLDNATAPEAIRLQSRLILDDLEGRSSGHPAPLSPAASPLRSSQNPTSAARAHWRRRGRAGRDERESMGGPGASRASARCCRAREPDDRQGTAADLDACARVASARGGRESRDAEPAGGAPGHPPSLPRRAAARPARGAAGLHLPDPRARARASNAPRRRASDRHRGSRACAALPSRETDRRARSNARRRARADA